jgi:hypothetical protein
MKGKAYENQANTVPVFAHALKLSNTPDSVSTSANPSPFDVAQGRSGRRTGRSVW